MNPANHILERRAVRKNETPAELLLLWIVSRRNNLELQNVTQTRRGEYKYITNYLYDQNGPSYT